MLATPASPQPETPAPPVDGAPAPARRQLGPRVAWLFGALGLLALVVVAGFQLGGEGSQLAQQGALLAPLFGLAALLQLGRARRGLALVAWGWFWVLLVASSGLTLGIVALATDYSGAEPTAAQATAIPLTGATILVALWIAVGLSFSGWWHCLGRRFGANLTRGDPAHAQGLVGLLIVVVLALIPLFALDGRAPLLVLIARDEAAFTSDRSATGQLLDLLYNVAWIIPLAILAAGAPLQRGLRAALGRLGVGPLRPRDIPVLVGIALALVLFAFGLDGAIARVWELFGWPRTDAHLVQKLFGQTISPAGAIAIAISAGVGEELIARGLLQPRFGWFLPNLAFAVGHAFQYGPDGVLSVFVTGSALAYVRHRRNTTAAAFTHGFYDFVLVLGAALHWPGF
jgi:membrane protease YdiL (CAAX protease family)